MVGAGTTAHLLENIDNPHRSDKHVEVKPPDDPMPITWKAMPAFRDACGRNSWFRRDAEDHLYNDVTDTITADREKRMYRVRKRHKPLFAQLKPVVTTLHEQAWLPGREGVLARRFVVETTMRSLSQDCRLAGTAQHIETPYVVSYLAFKDHGMIPRRSCRTPLAKQLYKEVTPRTLFTRRAPYRVSPELLCVHVLRVGPC